MQLFIEFCGETISSMTTKTICERLKKEKIQALSLRECTITDKDYKKILKAVASSYTIRHLSLCVDIVNDAFRVQTVAQTVKENLSLSGLFLYGSSIGDNGLKVLQPSLLLHPGIVILDLSDCNLGDEAVEYIFPLLPGNKDKHGLRELILSSNPDISSTGWNRLALALASGNKLTTLCIDYNDIGDQAAACILAAVAGSNTLESLDMEGTGVTDATGKLFLQLLSSTEFKLRDINLEENDISTEIMDSIRLRLNSHDLSLDQSPDVLSDDDRSLATSEPPLDDANSIFNSRRNSYTVNDELHHIDETSNGIKQSAAVTETRDETTKTFGTKLSRSAVFDQQGGSLTETEPFRSHSMIDIMPNDEDDSKSTGKNTRVEVIEQLEDLEETKEEYTGKKVAKVRSINNLLIPETPSLVSLHSYSRENLGQEDGEFQPIERYFNRPTSAPVVKNNRLTVQGIGSSPVRVKPSSHAVVPPTVKIADNKQKSLEPQTNVRRYSTGNALFVNGADSDTDASVSLRSASARNMSSLDYYTNDEDLDVEEL